MPIYEYECPKCGHQEERLEGINDNNKYWCSECNTSLNKVISNCSFQLKGSGWYATDYRNKGKESKPSSNGG